MIACVCAHFEGASSRAPAGSACSLYAGLATGTCVTGRPCTNPEPPLGIAHVPTSQMMSTGYSSRPKRDARLGYGRLRVGLNDVCALAAFYVRLYEQRGCARGRLRLCARVLASTFVKGAYCFKAAQRRQDDNIRTKRAIFIIQQGEHTRLSCPLAGPSRGVPAAAAAPPPWARPWVQPGRGCWGTSG